MTSEVKTSITLSELGIEEGDTLYVNQVDGTTAVLSLTKRGKEESKPLSASQFLQKWSGKFSVPEADGDPRIAHLLEKHVN